MKTRLTEMLGIEHPIICGGMMRVGTAELAAAASNAGALGVMTALTSGSPEQLEKDIALAQSLTDKPFAVNLTVGVVATPINYDDLVDVIIAMMNNDDPNFVGPVNIGNPGEFTIKQLAES